MARTPEQQAELTRLRKAKAARLADTVNVTAESVAPPTDAEQAEMTKAAAFAALMDFMGFGDDYQGPSWKRKLAAVLGSAVLAFGAGYIVGELLTYMIVGVYVMTGSALLAYLLMMLGLLLAMYAGMKIGQAVGNYVLSGQIDRDIVRVKDTVRGWFKRAPKPELRVAA